MIYTLNDIKCAHCIGWNHKDSNKEKYINFEEACKKINIYSIDNENMLQYIKDLEKIYKNYKKAKEKEKTYTEKDYKKMQLEFQVN